MSVTASSFRQSYPEFADAGNYPDATINMHIGVAVQMLNPVNWAGMLDFGTCLWVAHFLVLGFRDQTAASTGGAGGTLQGVLTAKSVDKVSASYDGQSIALENMGFWGLTSYGLRLLQFARMFGAGGIQLTPPLC